MIPSASLLPTDTAAADKPTALFQAAQALARALGQGRSLDAAALRSAMTHACGGDDASGAWIWKDAYDAAEAAFVLHLRRFGRLLRARAATPADLHGEIARLAARMPSQTRRSEEQQQLQQFSTPPELAIVVALAGQPTAGETILEPSAGTGLLAVMAELLGGIPILNEFAATRAGLLTRLFRDGTPHPVTRHDAETLHDRLDPAIQPTLVLMNPPFSASPNVDRRRAVAAIKHIGAALARLPPGGRLVTVTGEGMAPDRAAWRDAFTDLQGRLRARLVFTAGIDGRAYARHGTGMDTRLTVIDRVPADDPAAFPASAGTAAHSAALLDLVVAGVPPRPPIATGPSETTVRPWRTTSPASPNSQPSGATARPIIAYPTAALFPPAASSLEPVEIAYVAADPVGADPAAGDAIASDVYDPYRLQSIRFPGARPHPGELVESTPMAAVKAPMPSYRPHLRRGQLECGIPSDVQLESIVYAGEAHSGHLPGHFLVDPTWDKADLTRADLNEIPDGHRLVRFRRGWMLGDGTGVGKGVQVAGIILDNWLKGRRRALWVSKTDTLIEDARRDWTALGGDPVHIVPLSTIRQDAPIRLRDGILFTTYATLRSEGRAGKPSRVQQIVGWLGPDFDGVIVFDEAHEMANAAGGKTDRGAAAPSLQGRAGLRLQHALPDARVVYASATGATRVQNLAYAQRLGLWGTADSPFDSRGAFVAAMEAGGIAAMEVLARDLKALGLYLARSLSFAGVEVDLLEHRLTPEQTALYDTYAEAYGIIHRNLTAALAAANVTGPEGTLNRNVLSAARSAFEGCKQRFFNHLLAGMKCPTLLAAIQADLDRGEAAVVQLVSTNEALLDRRLAEIPSDEWGDLDADLTPKEYVLDYLRHGFPTRLYEVFTDADGNMHSRPALDADGNQIQCRDAIERRDALLDHVAALPAVQGALDQLLQHFGTDAVAEVTGRTRRVVRRMVRGHDRLCVETRPASANLAETAAFMEDRKPVLVFSTAGGTGRSYHAARTARNRRRRNHYLLEAGWRADVAIQGLGRTHRTNQESAPVFRPVATDVKGEKRFLSTIARRLDTLGAITRGQRRTAGQGLFRAEDNLESEYARTALRKLYAMIVAGRLDGCSLALFEDATGLTLVDRDGTLKEELPPITTFLNRVLALRIALQNLIFQVFTDLLDAVVDGAIASGTFDRGVETITADSLIVRDRRIVYTHPGTGAVTTSLTVDRKTRARARSLDEVRALAAERPDARPVWNEKSRRAALLLPAGHRTLESGAVEARVRLIRPQSANAMSAELVRESAWVPADWDLFDTLWTAELAAIPAFTVDTIHLLTGILLPVWKLIDPRSPRVWRLTTDAGEKLIGLVLEKDELPAVYARLGVDLADTDRLSPPEAWRLVMDKGAILTLGGGLTLRRTRAMGLPRLVLTGFAPDAVPGLKALGLESEIVNFKLMLYLPTGNASVGTRGLDILTSLLERHPIVHVHAPD